MTHPDPTPADGPFTDSRIDRRTFMRIAGATGATLTLPGTATADVTSSKFEAAYEYAVNHTPAEFKIPTLVTFADESGPTTFASTIEADARTTTTPTPAAYAELTAVQAEQAAELPTAETFSLSPGANPFWRLGYYPLGVFPDPQRSTDFIDFEEMIAGLEHLQVNNQERLDVFTIGQSPGHYNFLTDREDPKDIYVAEITNDIQDREAYREKTKVMYTLSIHGSERPGAEAGSRFIENLLDGREAEIEQLLDDVVLIFIYQNPDGWVARHPQYESAGGLPGVPVYERGNAEVGDTNRQYPIAGWIDPIHYPAEPNGANLQDDDPGIDRDVPDDIFESVPDALALVEHFRDYENLDYGVDLHSMALAEEFVLGLINQDQYDHRQLHELYGMNRAVDERLESELTTWNTAADVQRAITGDTNPEYIEGFGVLPEEAFDYSTIYDTLGYTVSGSYISWLAHPPELGGVDLTTMAFEVVSIAGVQYVPELVDMQVRGYVTSVRTVAEYAVQNSDTPNTADQFDATIDTGGLSTAYVTTDALTRSSADLEFAADAGDDGGSGASSQLGMQRDTTEVSLDGGGATVPLDVPEGAHTVSVEVVPAAGTFLQATLRDPAGAAVKTVDQLAPEDRHLGFELDSLMARDPEAGRWQVELEPDQGTAGGSATVETATMTASGSNPDPRAQLGYDQREYKVSPFVYFDKSFIPSGDPLRATTVNRDYADVADAAVDALSFEDVIAGEHLAYDNLVVIHDDTPDTDTSGYLTALETFVEDGGNLVLTDTGLHLLGDLDTALTGRIEADDVATIDPFYVANLGQKVPDQPLLEDTREIQQMLWKIAPLGYSIPSEGADDGEAPMTLVDQAAFEDAGGRVAGTTNGSVAAGTLASPAADGTVRELVRSDQGSVQVISSLLPPAKQTNLHPFGMLDYAVSFLGHTMLVNALGHVQKRFIDGEVVRTFGGQSTYSTAIPDLQAAGSRQDDGSAFTGGQTNQVEITVDELSERATVYDQVPDGWTVLTEFSEDVTRVDGNNVYFGELGPIGSGGDSVTVEYFVEAPSGPDNTGEYTFGAATAVTEEGRSTTFGGTDTNLVVGVDTRT
jgi:hypothetical protein